MSSPGLVGWLRSAGVAMSLEGFDHGAVLGARLIPGGIGHPHEHPRHLAPGSIQARNPALVRNVDRINREKPVAEREFRLPRADGFAIDRRGFHHIPEGLPTFERLPPRS